jgi:hypothetical protein
MALSARDRLVQLLVADLREGRYDRVTEVGSVAASVVEEALAQLDDAALARVAQQYTSTTT